jgi:Lysine-specific metallo-endopeptidase
MGSPALGSKEFSLQCSIEAAPEQMPGRPVIVKGIFQNTDSRTIYILPRNTFLDPSWGDCVWVTRNDVRVEYYGPAGQGGGGERDEFIKIPSGESRSAEIDITEHYNVWEPGEYELSFRMPVEGGPELMLGTGPDVGFPKVVFSDTIRFRMAGAQPPSFQMDQGAEGAFRDAYFWAYEGIVAGLVEAQRLGPNYKACFDEKLGDGWQQRHDTVLSSLKAMVDWVSTKSILLRSAPGEGACAGDTIGATKPSARGPIELCPKAFNDFWLGQAYGSAARGRAFVLVHEISHAAAGTRDEDYDAARCARTDPNLAVVNAQNYAELALRCSPAPTGARRDNGIWSDRAVSSGGGRTDRGPAAIEVAPNVVMVAYREPEPPKLTPEAHDVGGQLCYKMLHLSDGRSDWKNATPFRPAFAISGARELRSLVTPALARWNGDTYCAYIDVSLGLVSLRARDPGVNSSPDWQQLNWVGTRSETVEEPIESPGSHNMHFGPALAEYTGGKSAGLYCAYVDPDDGLKCKAKFDGQSISGRGLGDWTEVKFDRPRKSDSAPALAVFQGQLKCAYRDKVTAPEKSRYVILTYQPAQGPQWDRNTKPGIWVEERSFPDLETSTIALATLETAAGPRLVAVGSVIPITGQASDTHLRYSVLGSDGKWSKGAIAEEYGSNGVTALVPVNTTGGRLLYAFVTGRDGNIELVTARA